MDKEKIEKLKLEVFKALSCLLLEVDESIATDIKTKVENLIKEYEKK